MDLEIKMPDLSKFNLEGIKKKAIKIGIIVIAAIVILIIGITLKNAIFGYKIPYNNLEKLAASAAKKYFTQNEELLPQIAGASAEVNIETLSNEKLIKPIEKMTNAKKDQCTAKVTVTNTGDDFNYVTYLTCSNYETENLTKKLIENRVDQGSGLYEKVSKAGENEGFIFRGEYVDNFISFGGLTWRILGITVDGRLRLLQDDFGGRTAWDNRYNNELKRASGINTFQITEGQSSRIKEYFDNLYRGNKISESAKARIVPQTLCRVKNSEKEIEEGKEECKEYIYENQAITAILIAEYAAASIDNSCKNNLLVAACRNYNYLSIVDREYWTLSPGSDNTGQVYYIFGRPFTAEANSVKYTKMVIELAPNIAFKEGEGTAAKPFTIKD